MPSVPFEGELLVRAQERHLHGEHLLTTFEYISVMHSIVLALGIARLLTGFADLVHYWRRLNIRAFFLGWLTLVLSLHMGWWFGLWARFGGITDIALSTYLLWFAVPAALYVASRLLVPEFRDGVVPDLKERFEQVRVPFFCSLAVPMVMDLPGLLSGTAPPTVWLLPLLGILAVSGAVFSSPRWHRLLLPLMAGVYLTFMVLTRSSLGA